jgi:arylsulfatase A-like enzyme
MGADDLRTPNLDRLAADGIRFTDFYVNSAVCSPSRAALLTGRHPARAGVRDVLGGHRTETGFPPDVPTLAEALRPLGYRTGLIGKWHLGVAGGYRPQDRGFETFFGKLCGAGDYFSHIEYNLWPWNLDYHPVHDLWEGDREVWRNGRYLTELISERAVTALRDWETDASPFLLVVSYTAPHSPMHAPAEYIDRFRGLPPARRVMAAMISAMDDGVGMIVAKLERQGRLEDTAIVFLSDNGPSRHPGQWLDGSMETYYGGSAGALKGGKTSLFDGGIRSPVLLHWPARIPGGQVVREPAQAIDLFPTFLAAAGGDPAAFDLDGRDLTRMLVHGGPSPHAELLWEFREQTAIRRGPWKLVLDGYQWEGQPPEDPVFLSNLDEDIGESVNLAGRHPELAAELRATAEAWRAAIEAEWVATGHRPGDDH